MNQEATEEMKDKNSASQIMVYYFWFCRHDVSKNTSSESTALDIPNPNGLER